MYSTHKSRNRGVSTFIATLLLIVLAVAAGVVIYAYTMGYLGQTSVKTNQGAFMIVSMGQAEGILHVYAKNVGKDTILMDSPPNPTTRVYVDDKEWNFFFVAEEERLVHEGDTVDIQILDLDDYIGNTVSIKIVTISGAMTTTSVKLTDGVKSLANEFVLTVSYAGAGGGSVSLNPIGPVYLPGTPVTLTPNPDPGSSFSGWSGDLSGSANPASITMDSDKSVTATFTVNPLPTYHLSTNVVGSGSVDPSSGDYVSGTEVTLRATQAAGWVFSGWSGDASGSANPVTITIDGDKIVTATFTLVPPTFYTLNVQPIGSGTVNLDPSGGSYASGTTVTLTPQPQSGWVFSSWGGDLSGSANPATITMNDDKTITATFTSVQPRMHVASISMSIDSYEILFWKFVNVHAVVTVRDANGNPVQSVTVTGAWSGGYTRSPVSGSTNTIGQRTFNTDWQYAGWPGTTRSYTFTVTNLSRSGWVYDQSANFANPPSGTVVG